MNHRRSQPTLAVVAAVNNEAILQRDLAASPIIRDGGVPLFVERHHMSAAAALNAGRDRTDADLVVFAHQDVYLPRCWEERLLAAVRALDQRREEWAVLGIAGVDTTGRFVGRFYSSGLDSEFGGPLPHPEEVVSLDEVLIVLRSDCGLRFDEHLPGFHLYGTDIVQMARNEGLTSFAVDAPVVHNSTPKAGLDYSYRKAYRFMQRKWSSALPIPTCIVPITRSDWSLHRHRLRLITRRLYGRVRRAPGAENPAAIARRLGYEREA